MISRRQEIFPPSIEHLQMFFLHGLCRHFFLICQISHNRVSLCKQFFSDAPLGQTIFQQFFSCRQFFSQSRYPPPRENNGPFLMVTEFEVHTALDGPQIYQSNREFQSGYTIGNYF